MRRTWLSRRGVVMGAATIPIVFALRPSRILAASDDGVPFDAAFVRQLARDLAQKPYKAPEHSLPDSLKNLSYDAYRTLRFLPDRALWRGETLSFRTVSTSIKFWMAKPNPSATHHPCLVLGRSHRRRQRQIAASVAFVCMHQSTVQIITMRLPYSLEQATSAPSPKDRHTACPHEG